jgi:hypothetical protein
VEVVWQGDEFEITIPPRFTLRGFVFLLILTTVALVCWFLAFDPRSDLGVIKRVAPTLVGTAAAVGAIMLMRQCRTWTRLILRKGRLECSVPSLRGERVTRYLFSSFADASVGKTKSKRDRGSYLLLHRRSGDVEQVLENSVYRVADLEIVAAAIREAIARQSNAPQPGE